MFSPPSQSAAGSGGTVSAVHGLHVPAHLMAQGSCHTEISSDARSLGILSICTCDQVIITFPKQARQCLCTSAAFVSTL